MLDGNVSLNAQSYWIDLAQHIVMNLVELEHWNQCTV